MGRASKKNSADAGGAPAGAAAAATPPTATATPPKATATAAAGGLPVMTEDQQSIMTELVRVSQFMDTSWITICGVGLGADGLLGLLLPEVGDIGTFFVSFWIMMRILFVFPDVFRQKWYVMTFNVGIDLVIGLIPLAGDAFDMLWHANVKNVNLVRKHYGLELLSEKAAAAAAAKHKKDQAKLKENGRSWCRHPRPGTGRNGNSKVDVVVVVVIVLLLVVLCCPSQSTGRRRDGIISAIASCQIKRRHGIGQGTSRSRRFVHSLYVPTTAKEGHKNVFRLLYSMLQLVFGKKRFRICMFSDRSSFVHSSSPDVVRRLAVHFSLSFSFRLFRSCCLVLNSTNRSCWANSWARRLSSERCCWASDERFVVASSFSKPSCCCTSFQALVTPRWALTACNAREGSFPMMTADLMRGALPCFLVRHNENASKSRCQQTN
jgi:Domain of unknown function (DUF4112)